MSAYAFVVYADCDNGRRFVVHGDEKVTAFMELGNRFTQVQGDLLFSRSKAKSYTSFGRWIMSFAWTKWGLWVEVLWQRLRVRSILGEVVWR
jgi:hypothetical protein